MNTETRILIAILVACCGPGLAARAGTPPHYHLARTIPVAGDDGWDLLSFDAVHARLFIAHGTRVQVIETRTFKAIGEIPDTAGVHGVALATDLGRGYISAGRSNTVVVFDLKSLARLAEI